MARAPFDPRKRVKSSDDLAELKKQLRSAFDLLSRHDARISKIEQTLRAIKEALK